MPRKSKRVTTKSARTKKRAKSSNGAVAARSNSDSDVWRRDRRPASRRLRGYALDPGAGTAMDTALINEVTFKVSWEDLNPGPVGEYIEVIDHDPASDCFYAPVDLNDPFLLAQDGLSPS